MKRTFILTAGILIPISILLVSLNSFRCAPASEKLSDERPAALNYENFCAGCHGHNLEKFAAKAWMDETGNTLTVKSITFGIEDIGMPAFQKTFSAAEIEALAAYVKKGIPEDKSKLKPAITPGGVVASEVQRFVVDTVVSGLSVPWGLAFLPNGDLLISERSGTLHIFSGGKLSPPIEGLPPLMAFGQGGLLDLALHPDYATNGWIYISYSALNTESNKRIGNTAVMRAKLEG